MDLDPCSNLRSTVRARLSIMLNHASNRVRKRKGFIFGNGLHYDWSGLTVYFNPPYSDVLPWALKAWTAAEFCSLVNTDNSTEWWAALTEFPCFQFQFYDRISFDAPLELETSQNDRPQSMICSPGFRKMIGESFKGLGRWYRSE